MKKQLLIILPAALVLMITACGKEENGGIIKKTGSKVGETVTDFVTGIGKGVDKKLKIKVRLDDSLKAIGVKTTVANSAGTDKNGRHIIDVYLITVQPLNAELTAKAFDADKQEIGRSTVQVNFKADDAKYITFDFDKAMDTSQVAEYFIYLHQTRPEVTPEQNK